MTGVNSVFLMGNLTKDPETKSAGSSNITSFGLAVNRSYKDKSGEWQEQTDFFNVDVWGKQGENCSQYLSKGKKVFIEGRLAQDRWEDSNGNKRSAVKVVANSVTFLSPKDSGSSSEAPF